MLPESSAPFHVGRGDPPRVMGILNATPDSFSGDGLGGDVEALAERGLQQAAAGAAILDIGGESTRPGASPASAEEELARVRPLLERLVGPGSVPISIDTVKPRVARSALELGARAVNDVSGLQDPALAHVAAEFAAWLVLTHNRASAQPSRDKLGGYYRREPGSDLVAEVASGLMRLVDEAVAAGISPARLILDPGLGFGKSPRENLELLKHLRELRDGLAPFPMLIGASRKSFVGRVLGLPVQNRLEGSLACVAYAAFHGVELIRVHDVLESARVVRMTLGILAGSDADFLEVQ